MRVSEQVNNMGLQHFIESNTPSLTLPDSERCCIAIEFRGFPLLRITN